ncbi:hypothetical protein ABZ137_30540 [Streptomyces bobili]|uniref:hypothetical protein n=1 Tax=Streptomyces bobili TaxID=67280 RepID=UPI0033A924AF
MAGPVRGTAVALVLAVAVSGCAAVSERRDDVRAATVAFEKAPGERDSKVGEPVRTMFVTICFSSGPASPTSPRWD